MFESVDTGRRSVVDYEAAMGCGVIERPKELVCPCGQYMDHDE